MKTIASIFFLALLASCTTTRHFKTGHYKYDGFYGVAYNLVLNEDMPFVYRWNVGLDNGVTEGKWRIKNKYVFLTGGSFRPEKKMVVQEVLSEARDSIYFHVKNIDGEPIFHAEFVLNGEYPLIINPNGTATINIMDLDQIELVYPKLDTEVYKIRSDSCSYFLITLDIARPSAYFNNEKLVIRNGTLIMRDNKITTEKLKLRIRD